MNELAPEQSPSVEVEAPSIAVAGRNIRLQWRLPAGCGEVKVVRKEGDAPRHHADGQVVPVHLIYAQETGLRPDVLYCYRICAGLGGGEWSQGVVVQARTQANATGVEERLDLVAQDFGHYLALQWRWPVDASSFLVSWRRDGRSPLGPEDAEAQHREVNRSDYMRRGGFRIERPDSGPWHFAVYPISGEPPLITYGASAEAALRTDERVTLWYDVRRRPLRDSYDLRVWAEVDVPLIPQIVLTAEPGNLVPEAFDPTRILATATRTSLVAGLRRVVCQFPLGKQRRRPFVLRAFCREPGQAASFFLAPHAPQRLVFD